MANIFEIWQENHKSNCNRTETCKQNRACHHVFDYLRIRMLPRNQYVYNSLKNSIYNFHHQDKQYNENENRKFPAGNIKIQRKNQCHYCSNQFHLKVLLPKRPPKAAGCVPETPQEPFYFEHRLFV